MLHKKFIFELNTLVEDDGKSDLKICAVTNKELFKEFYEIPWKIYSNDPNWVPPFWKEYKELFYSSNPFWSHAEAQLFIVYKNNTAVGRIAAIIDRLFVEKEKKPIGYFGFFECTHDYKVASALFTAAESWLQSKEITVLRGPINGRIDIGCGFLYEGFDSPPSILETYSPKYYIEFAESYGFQKCKDLVSYTLDLTPPIPSQVEEAAKRVLAQGITIRGFDRLHAKQEIAWWIPLMMQGFAHHWGYVAVPEEEVRLRFGIKQARWFIDSGLFLIAEADGKPISFKWSTPDYNQVFKTLNGNLGFLGILKFFIKKRSITRGSFNFVGITKQYRGQGIGTFMNYYTMLEMKRRGYTSAECGWIDEDNIASRKAIEKIGAQLKKVFRVYEKTVSLGIKRNPK